MINALNAAATGMSAQAKQVETISNNLANADTVSFKKSRAEFQDLLYQSIKEPGTATSATTQHSTGIQIGVGTQVSAVSRDDSDGTLRQTSRPLDFAIQGRGLYFSIQTPNGDIAYTRDGSFQIGPEGRLQTAAGLPVVPEIAVPPNARSIEVAPDGRVLARISATETQELGQFQITSFANPAGLQAAGSNLFLASTASGAPTQVEVGSLNAGRLFQGYLESSNVNAITEMTDLIRAQRTLELNSKVIQSTDQMMSTLNQVR
jgi:flagellar basal-body rod protein FlgG